MIRLPHRPRIHHSTQSRHTLCPSSSSSASLLIFERHTVFMPRMVSSSITNLQDVVSEAFSFASNERQESSANFELRNDFRHTQNHFTGCIDCLWIIGRIRAWQSQRYERLGPRQRLYGGSLPHATTAKGWRLHSSYGTGI
jgi:hypothetical protein